MADGKRRGMFKERTHESHDAMVEEIVPSSAWTEDSDVHYLLVDLPGFKKEEVKLHIDDSGHVIVSGERLVKDSKFIIFEQTFKIPENSDADQITGKFDGEILYVTVPKLPIKKHENKPGNANSDVVEGENVHHHERYQVKEKKAEEAVHRHERYQVKEKKAKEADHHHKAGFPKEVGKKYWGSQQGSELLELAKEMLQKNRGIVITAALAFSLGFFVACKFQ